jgi:hypothetical protein
VIVGAAFNASFVGEAFIWDAANGMRSLQDMLVNDFGLALSGWTLGQAEGISDDGMTIVGFGTNPSGLIEGWAAHIEPIPVPASLFLLASGLVGLAMRRTVKAK